MGGQAMSHADGLTHEDFKKLVTDFGNYEGDTECWYDMRERIVRYTDQLRAQLEQMTKQNRQQRTALQLTPDPLRQAAGQVAKDFGAYADLEPVDTTELMDRLVIFAKAQRVEECEVINEHIFQESASAANRCMPTNERYRTLPNEDVKLAIANASIEHRIYGQILNWLDARAKEWRG